MSRRALAILSGLGVFGALSFPAGQGAGVPGLSINTASAQESGPPRPESCMSFSKGNLDKGISFDIESHCEMKLACKVSWVVQCADNDGKVESRTTKREQFGLENGESRGVPMSAETCKQSWKVENVSWGCDPVKK